MTTFEKREALKKVYPGKRWAQKVDRMTDAQVIAVFMRLRQDNKL